MPAGVRQNLSDAVRTSGARALPTAGAR
jgi:hypothetical protein